MLTWHCIDEERDDRSFMGVEIVSWGWNSSALFPKYKYVGNMKLPLWLALEADNEHGAMDTVRGKGNEHTWWYGQWTHMMIWNK
jgi:hypothetical protein